MSRNMPAAVRAGVWNKYIDEAKPECYVGCGEKISAFNFECGHVISRKHGGGTTIQNLRPICSRCNKSMGVENMETFIQKYGFKEKIVKPYLYQEEIINKAIIYFKNSDRGKLNLFCRLGKTYISYWIAEKIKSSEILYLVPSLDLLYQTYYALKQVSDDYNYLLIGSKNDGGEATITTNQEVIKKFMKTNTRYIIVSTYQSSKLFTKIKKTIDMCIYDEAHKTSGCATNITGFKGLLEDGIFTIKKRLYLTATEKVYIATKKEDKVYSMDDERIYGQTIESINCGEALQLGAINNYRIIIINGNPSNDKKIRYQYEAKAESLLNIIKRKKIVHVITFHNKIMNAELFSRILKKQIRFRERKRKRKIKIDVMTINGKHNIKTRREILKKCESKKRTIITSARVLQEGINLPMCDAVVFIDNKTSLVDCVQSVSRCLTKKRGKSRSYIIIPLTLKISKTINSKEIVVLRMILKNMAEYDNRIKDFFRNILEHNKNKNDIIKYISWQQHCNYSRKSKVHKEISSKLEANKLYNAIVEILWNDMNKETTYKYYGSQNKEHATINNYDKMKEAGELSISSNMSNKNEEVTREKYKSGHKLNKNSEVTKERNNMEELEELNISLNMSNKNKEVKEISDIKGTSNKTDDIYELPDMPNIYEEEEEIEINESLDDLNISSNMSNKNEEVTREKYKSGHMLNKNEPLDDLNISSNMSNKNEEVTREKYDLGHKLNKNGEVTKERKNMEELDDLNISLNMPNKNKEVTKEIKKYDKMEETDDIYELPDMLNIYDEEEIEINESSDDLNISSNMSNKNEEVAIEKYDSGHILNKNGEVTEEKKDDKMEEADDIYELPDMLNIYEEEEESGYIPNKNKEVKEISDMKGASNEEIYNLSDILNKNKEVTKEIKKYDKEEELDEIYKSLDILNKNEEVTEEINNLNISSNMSNKNKEVKEISYMRGASNETHETHDIYELPDMLNKYDEEEEIKKHDEGELDEIYKSLDILNKNEGVTKEIKKDEIYKSLDILNKNEEVTEEINNLNISLNMPNKNKEVKEIYNMKGHSGKEINEIYNLSDILNKNSEVAKEIKKYDKKEELDEIYKSLDTLNKNGEVTKEINEICDLSDMLNKNREVTKIKKTYDSSNIQNKKGLSKECRSRINFSISDVIEENKSILMIVGSVCSIIVCAHIYNKYL